jgi:hypothetical protein
MTQLERSANITDLDFIQGCILFGARKGHYSFDPENPVLVHWMKKEIRSVVTSRMLLDGRQASASVFLTGHKRIATMILSQAAPGSHSLEIYALSVIREFQHKGFGSRIIKNLLEHYPDVEIFARCTPSSVTMYNLLLRKGFRFNCMDNDFRVLTREPVSSISRVAPVYSAQ